MHAQEKPAYLSQSECKYDSDLQRTNSVSRHNIPNIVLSENIADSFQFS